MKSNKSVSKIIGYSIFGAISAFFLNYLVIENIIIPDPCYYHSHDTGKLFNTFYELSSGEGYHPFPTIFNLILTLFIGGVSGFLYLQKTTK